MKSLNRLNSYRVEFRGSTGGETYGAFKVFIGGRSFFIVASDGGGWDHVSVSPCNQKRCPTWDEMCAVKSMFFKDDEAVMQLHPKKADYVNRHPFCLHMWRPQQVEIPMPPKIMV